MNTVKLWFKISGAKMRHTITDQKEVNEVHVRGKITTFIVL